MLGIRKESHVAISTAVVELFPVVITAAFAVERNFPNAVDELRRLDSNCPVVVPGRP